MINNFIFVIIPNPVLFPQYKPFKMRITRNINFNIERAGWLYTNYTWECLPGNMSAVSGYAVPDERRDKSNFAFYIEEKDTVIGSRNYGILYDIPLEFTVGSSGFAMVGFAGFKKSPSEEDATLYSKWQLFDAY